MSLALKRGFLIPSAEIYNGPAGFYDFGPVGSLLKRRLQEAWRDLFIRRDGNLEVETVSILPEEVLKASGHVAHFADPIVECGKCKQRLRADHLLGDFKAKELALAGDSSAKKKPYLSPEELEKLRLFKTEGKTNEELSQAIISWGVPCPSCGAKEFAAAKPFNLMFSLNIGPKEGSTGYARPETAQGIFLDFPRVFRMHGSKLPLGVGQIGRSFRNEIAPRQGLLRLREFSQMELEYFFNPEKPFHHKFSLIQNEKIRLLSRESQLYGKEELTEISASEAVEKKIVPNQIVAYFLIRCQQFYDSLGVKNSRFRHMLAEETPHYSGGNFDLEVETSYGWIETIGVAYRTDYDLSSHAKQSGKDLSVFLEEDKKKLIPHVVEPSLGVDRLFWCVLEHSYRPNGGAEGRDWEWLDLPPAVAPFVAAIFPLMKKQGLPEKALEIVDSLRADGMDVLYDESGSIGKRYARADEIGIPYCLTVDFDSLSANDVTIRFRNDGRQVRIPIDGILQRIKALVGERKVTA